MEKNYILIMVVQIIIITLLSDVFIYSFVGIIFLVSFCEIFESILGKNYYINNIANNTYSIMKNNVL